MPEGSAAKARDSGSRRGRPLDADGLLFDPRRHFEALFLKIRRHLDNDRPDLAFPYADRRCRLLRPDARDFLLRSEISRRAGLLSEGARDLDRALELDPTDRHVLQVALIWGEPAQKSLAARLALSDDDPDAALAALAVDWLASEGETLLFSVCRRDRLLTGWAAWTGAAEIHLRLVGDFEESVVLSPESDHWLANEIRFAATIRWPAEENFETATLLRDGSPVATRVLKVGSRVYADVAREPVALSVIVPVYEDFTATCACFEALFAQGSPIAMRIIAVDDASPNADLRAWLDNQAATGRVVLLRNDQNLGFAASVNRALKLCPEGDVVLLNADALPPPGSLARLAEVARSSPDIGTVTPFSNNGEYTSLPVANAANPMEAPADIARIDILAHQANGFDFVDLPNGIGFCLFVTRACLDAVGRLPELYDRGYFEDVEFCLRAREKGFRNVCATGVYVGHEGSRSFLAEKRRLVMRNLAILERRFPEYQAESASFVEADPLRRARGAVEALLPADVGRVALVCAGGARFLARSRAEVLAKDGGPAPMICVCADARAELRGVPNGWPQSLDFPLNDRAGLQRLLAFLRATKISRIELFDPLALEPALLAALVRLGVRVEIAAGDLEWAIPMRTPFDGACRASDAPGLCPSCAEGAFQVGAEEEVRRRRLKRKRAILARADAVRPLDRMSEQIAAHMFGDVAVEPFVVPPVAARPSSHPAAGGVLAMILPQPDARAERIVVAFGRALRRLDELARIVVFGACVNDLAVMRTGNIFVAGPVEIDEYDRLLRQYEISALMSPYRGRLFGWTDRLSNAFAMPKACFDYSFGKLTLEDGDLALDPRLCDAKAASRAAQWFAALPRRAAR